MVLHMQFPPLHISYESETWISMMTNGIWMHKDQAFEIRHLAPVLAPEIKLTIDFEGGVSREYLIAMRPYYCPDVIKGSARTPLWIHRTSVKYLSSHLHLHPGKLAFQD
ncbi:hypothetical protein WG66_008183 [Moniliophthora roreri]|nr:hypothetical protein WG66_008183 [Moniliophthora roreri]